PMPMDERVRDAIANLERTTLVIFASANAVDIFFRMLLSAGGDARSLYASKLCAIGQETAESLEARGLGPELVTSEYKAGGLGEGLGGWVRGGRGDWRRRSSVGRWRACGFWSRVQRWLATHYHRFSRKKVQRLRFFPSTVRCAPPGQARPC